jgi:hypothetical protein
MKRKLTPLDQVQDKYLFPVTPLIDSPSKDISKTLPRLIIPELIACFKFLINVRYNLAS